MANNKKENKIEKFTKEAIGKTLNQFNKEIGIADLVEINKNQDRILNGILSQVNDENTEKTEKSNIIMLDNSTDGIVELKEIQGDTNVNVSKIEEEMPITHDIGEKEGNVFTLNEITQGAISIGEIQGNTMVNCNKDDEKELVLMKDLSTQGYDNVTLTEGVDGGLVDVALEGNTMVNVCDQKDPVAITKSYTVETGNHIALQGEYDGKCRPVVTGNTLWIDNATEEILTAFDDSKNLRLQSSFEDKVVTQEMIDAGEELAENLGKYKVDYVVTGKNKFDKSKTLDGYEIASFTTGEVVAREGWFVATIKTEPNTSYKVSGKSDGATVILYDYNKNVIWYNKEGADRTFTTPSNCRYIKVNGLLTQKDTFQLEEGSTATPYEPYKEYKKTFYLNSPLLEGDTIEQQGDDVVHVHRYGKVVLDGSEDEGWTESIHKRDNYYRVCWNIGNYSIPVICDKIVSKNVQGLDEEGINISGTLDVQIANSRLSEVSVNGFKAWLQSNPMTVVVKLKTPQYEVISTNDTILCDSYINGHLDVDSVIPIEKVVFMETPRMALKYLYPSTDYIIQFESDNTGSATIVVGGKSIGIKTITNGINKFNATTNEAPNTQLKIGGIGFNASNIVVTEATDQDFGYFEGMKSVGECEDLEVVSSNSDGTLSNTQTLTHEPLRAVGDVKDKYVLIDGKWYIERNCGEVVFDGSEDEIWAMDTSVYVFKYNISNVYYDGIFGEGICDKYIQVKGVIGKALGKFKIQQDKIMFGNNSINSISDWKTYLQSNPVTVVYQLATPTYEPIDYNPFTVYSDITHISNNSTIPCNMTIKNTGYNCLLKPSTTYTVSSNLGLNTVTTPSVLSEDCLRFYDTDTSTVTTMNNVTILEGDYTTGKPIPSHFSGIESAFEQEYDETVGKYKVKAKVVGKNLFDVNKISRPITNKYYYGGINKWREYKLKPYTTYNISTIVTNNNNPMSYSYLCNTSYKNINYIVRGNNPIGTKGSKCITTGSDGLLIIGDYYGIITDYADMIITENSSSEYVEYEPYKENYIEFYINEPLRGIGDVKDKVYIKDNKVVVERNCGSITFDGSNDEGWVMEKIETLTLFFKIPFTSYVENAYNKVICNNLNGSYGNDALNDKPNIITARWSQINVRLSKPKLQTQDVAGFKQWLQQNPTTVVYQLAEPTYEEVDYQEQRLFLNTYNNSTLFYESNIPVSNTSFKPLWEELAYLKNSTKYYIQFNSSANGTVVFNLGGTEVTKDIVEGYNNIAITTPAETTNLLTIDGHGIKISEVVVSESVCSGYYLGLQSCFEEHMENGKYRVLLRGIALDGSKVNGIKLYLNEPLRGIGDIKDRLCIKNGKLMVERKCKEVVFDGSTDEKWINFAINANNNQPNTAFCEIKIGDYSIKGICESYKMIKDDIWGKAEYDSMKAIAFRSIGDSGKIQILIPKSYLTTLDIIGFRNYLNQNPIKAVYSLLTPTYEEVTNEYGLPIVFEGYENGIVYIDSAVTPTTHIKYTSNNQLATTLSETKGQNNSTQDDINVNVVTYMMDIDMLLTEMEMSNDISVMAVRRDNNNENMLDRMSEEDKKVYQDNTVVMLEKMITANVLEKEDIEERIDMYYDKNRISKEQYKYLKSLL